MYVTRVDFVEAGVPDVACRASTNSMLNWTYQPLTGGWYEYWQQ